MSRISNDEILRLAVPAIVANITTPLLGLMDVAITGHLGGAVYIAAIAVGSTMFNMIYWLFGFLRMGTSGMTAQACGRRDIVAASAILHKGLLLALCAGALIILFRHPLGRLALGLMDVNADTAREAMTYFTILAWGAPMMLATFAMTGWLLGMQNSKAGMWVSILVNLVNILASLVLVFVLRLKIEGVAFGTLSAQTAGFAAAMLCCRRMGYRFFSTGSAAVSYGHFFNVNVFIFLRTLCLIAVTVWFTRSGAMQGTDILAVNALLMQLFTLFSYFMDGFAYAGEALTGKYEGQGNRIAMHRCVRALFRWGIVMAAAFSLIYFSCGEWVLSLLTSERDIVDAALDYLPWAVTVPFAGFAAFVWDGVFIGLTHTRGMFAATLVAMALYFMVWWLLFPMMGNHGLWIAFFTWLIGRAGVQTVVYLRAIRTPSARLR